MPFVILTLAAVYLIAFFPYSFFRHDDWLILGNAMVKLPEDWSRMWKPTLFYADQEVAWFFRPFFKGLTYIFYQLFHFHYYAWLTALLIVFCATIFCGAKAVEVLGGKSRAYFFVVAFCTSFYIHFGSVVWMGEGMMNIPQIFLLTLSLLGFLHGTLRRFPFLSPLWQTCAFVCYVLALGFKESAVIHPGLLLAIMFSAPSYERFTRKQKIRWAMPYLVASFVYLVVRLSFPISPSSYHSYFSIWSVIKPLVFFVAPLLIIAVLAVIVYRKNFFENDSKYSGGLYAIFFGVSILPYLGHGFFSPGWLLVPCFFGVWCLSVAFPFQVRRGKLLPLGATITAIATIAITIHLYDLGWWQWGEGGRALRQYVSKSQDTPQQWMIFDCPSPDYPTMSFHRVVAFEAGMDLLWRMHHKSRAKFIVAECEGALSKYQAAPSRRFFVYQFPSLYELNSPDELSPRLKTALSQ